MYSSLCGTSLDMKERNQVTPTPVFEVLCNLTAVVRLLEKKMLQCFDWCGARSQSHMDVSPRQQSDEVGKVGKEQVEGQQIDCQHEKATQTHGKTHYTCRTHLLKVQRMRFSICLTVIQNPL